MSQKNKIILELYGDESVVNNAIVYGIVLVPTPLVNELETTLRLVKARHGGLGNPAIHCRELFAGDRRKKTSWAHLSPKKVFKLCEDIAFQIWQSRISSRIGFIDKRGLPTKMTFGGRLPSIPIKDKQLIAFAYTTALAGIERDPGIDKVRLWIDPDRTRIEWGKNHRQASNVPMTFDDPVKGPGTKLTPGSFKAGKPQLLEIADLVAYVSANALSAEARTNKENFLAIYNLINPEVRKLDFHGQSFLENPPYKSH